VDIDDRVMALLVFGWPAFVILWWVTSARADCLKKEIRRWSKISQLMFFISRDSEWPDEWIANAPRADLISVYPDRLTDVPLSMRIQPSFDKLEVLLSCGAVNIVVPYDPRKPREAARNIIREIMLHIPTDEKEQPT